MNSYSPLSQNYLLQTSLINTTVRDKYSSSPLSITAITNKENISSKKSLVNKERESSIQGRKILNNLEFGIVQGNFNTQTPQNLLKVERFNYSARSRTPLPANSKRQQINTIKTSCQKSTKKRSKSPIQNPANKRNCSNQIKQNSKSKEQRMKKASPIRQIDNFSFNVNNKIIQQFGSQSPKPYRTKQNKNQQILKQFQDILVQSLEKKQIKQLLNSYKKKSKNENRQQEEIKKKSSGLSNQKVKTHKFKKNKEIKQVSQEQTNLIKELIAKSITGLKSSIENKFIKFLEKREKEQVAKKQTLQARQYKQDFLKEQNEQIRKRNAKLFQKKKNTNTYIKFPWGFNQCKLFSKEQSEIDSSQQLKKISYEERRQQLGLSFLNQLNEMKRKKLIYGNAQQQQKSKERHKLLTEESQNQSPCHTINSKVSQEALHEFIKIKQKQTQNEEYVRQINSVEKKQRIKNNLCSLEHHAQIARTTALFKSTLKKIKKSVKVVKESKELSNEFLREYFDWIQGEFSKMIENEQQIEEKEYNLMKQEFLQIINEVKKLVGEEAIDEIDQKFEIITENLQEIKKLRESIQQNGEELTQSIRILNSMGESLEEIQGEKLNLNQKEIWGLLMGKIQEEIKILAKMESKFKDCRKKKKRKIIQKKKGQQLALKKKQNNNQKSSTEELNQEVLQENFKILTDIVIIIQKTWRGYLSRKRLSEKLQQNTLLLESIATLIQKVWRGYHTRKILREYLVLLINKEDNNDEQFEQVDNNFYQQNEIIMEDEQEWQESLLQSEKSKNQSKNQIQQDLKESVRFFKDDSSMKKGNSKFNVQKEQFPCEYEEIRSEQLFQKEAVSDIEINWEEKATIVTDQVIDMLISELIQEPIFGQNN